MRDNDQGSPNKQHRSRSRSRSTSKSSKGSKKSVGDRSSYSKSRSRSRSRSSSQEIDGYRLHIADIGENVRKSDLEKLFSSYGTLREIWMTNSTPCFGFAVYKDKKDAATALTDTDGVEVAGCRIRVSYAKPRTRGSGRRFFNPNMRCYQCGYTGHFYRDCPELNGGGGDKRGGSRYDSHSDRYSSRRRDRDRGGDYHYDRDYGRRRHRSSRRFRGFFNPNRRCYQCWFPGHFYRDCPELYDGGGNKRGGSRYDSHSGWYSSRRRDRDYDYQYDRDYGRRRHRSSKKYDDHGSSRNNKSSRRHRY